MIPPPVYAAARSGRDAAPVPGRAAQGALAQNRPTVRPSRVDVHARGPGVLPSPGIWVISPHSGTSQPAPVYARMSRTGSVNPSGEFSSDGVGRQRQMGLGDAHREACQSLASELRELLLGLGIPRTRSWRRRPAARRLPPCPGSARRRRRGGEIRRAVSHARTTAPANSDAPAPPRANPSFTQAANAPASTARRVRSSSSSFVSAARRLIATTAGTPNASMIPRCRRTFAMPTSIAFRLARRSAGAPRQRRRDA